MTMPGGRSPVTRRDLLRLGAAGGLATGLGAAVTLGGAELAFGAPAGPGSADTLVVIHLRGGMDGLTVVPPLGDGDYAKARPTLAVPADLAKTVDGGFGLHPALAPLFTLWDAGRMAVVHAAGQAKPDRSHAGATLALEHGSQTVAARGGWIDRAAAAMKGSGAFTATHLGDPALPAALAGARRNLSTGSVDDLKIEVSDTIVPLAAWQAALTKLTAGNPTIGGPMGTALAAAAQAQSLAPEGTSTDAGYPATVFGQALHDVARLIRSNLGLRIAAVDFDGWDMHAGMGRADRGWMVNQLNELATTVHAFTEDLGPDLDGVVVVMLSEFGRRVAENGSGGTDHGYGGAVLVLGGGVNGGKVHGSWPTLTPGALVDGDLAVTTDYRHVLADVLSLRCGVRTIGDVFPGLPPSRLDLVKPLS